MQINYFKLHNTAGGRVVGFEMFLAYILPLIILELVIPQGWTTSLMYVGINWLTVFQLVLVHFSFLFFGHLLDCLSSRQFGKGLLVLSFFRLSPLFWSFAFLFLAVVFFLLDLSRIRYVGKATENPLGSFLSMFMVFFKGYFGTLAVCELLGSLRRVPRSAWLVFYVGLILTIDGMAHLMLLTFFTLFLVFPSFIRRRRSILGQLYIGGVFTFIVIFMYSVGIAWKGGADNFLVLFSSGPESFLDGVYWLVYRLSTVFLSVCALTEIALKDFYSFLFSWDILIHEIRYRFCVVLSLNGCSDYIQEFNSIGRYNFTLITWEDTGRGGASPGVLGSFLHLTPWFFSWLFAGFYYAFLAKLINVCCGRGKGISGQILVLVFSVYFLRQLFLNPASFLDPISGPFLGLLGSILAFSCIYRAKLHSVQID